MRDWIRWSCRRPVLVATVTPCLAIGAYFGWRAQLARGVDERQAMMQTIARLGGRFSLDTDFIDAPNYGPPQWLRSLIGEEYFSNIVSVNLGTTSISDEMVRDLSRLKHLQSLGIWHTRFDDDSLTSLARLRELETLDISQTDVTDEGLKQLRQFSSVRVLVVGGEQLTDSGLEPLKQMSQLTLLCIVGNQFSPTARQSLERALPDATVVFVPLPRMAGDAPRRPPVVPPNQLQRQPPPGVPAPKAPANGQFT